MTINPNPPFSPDILRQKVWQACALLKTLANEDRLMLLCHLVLRRMNVSELEQASGIHQPTLSQQLAVLRHEGLVETEKEGKYVYYRLADDKVPHIMRTLWELYCAPPPAPQAETHEPPHASPVLPGRTPGR
ncbi:MAG: metalloregulator ArsR/SmtB family transcription factor [Castellaniella sp.]|uniref:metalloregulator ArsR/SmtB family transcription factor n=1 Tax=Castellaniella sp. TaxID=1955812 RepID=UPI002A369F8C|nr:metalloregulator ArsR/SmtB family transcription factor [Castellaniella sp.]MDY0309399.1 metalloregulator ArsR/SmtB family transcription factor [Castellaniella sp.]